MKIFSIFLCNLVNMLYICIGERKEKGKATTRYIYRLYLYNYFPFPGVLLNVGIKREP